VPRTGKVEVILYNNLGQKITSIYAGTLTRGKHRLPLSDKINNLAAGTWLLHIQTATKTTPVKLLIQ
jgi:hypothetical protein